jgi:hypothetical protein
LSGDSWVRVRRGVARVGGASPKVSARASLDGTRRWVWLDSVLRTTEAAHELARKGAREPALILYEELARAGPWAASEPARAGRASLEERLDRARSSLAEWLHAELDGELAPTLAAINRTRMALVLSALVLVIVPAVSAVRAPRDIGTGAVDLGRERLVSAVELQNRLDCCAERARGAHVELSRDGKDFVVVAGSEQHASAFVEWRAHFRAAPARYVRLVGTRNELFHLSDVRIYGK